MQCRARAAVQAWHQSGLGQAEIARIRARIAGEGPLSMHAFDTRAESRDMGARPPHKKVLDQMWYAGDLATFRHKNFVKFYDLGERVFAPSLRDGPNEQAALQRLGDEALDRLGIATPGEVAAVLGGAKGAEARDWAALRLLNPFDPTIRERARLERLFGFTYRNEMFVPPAARRWGYSVYPLLEGGLLAGSS